MTAERRTDPAMWPDNVTSVDLLGFEYLTKAARRLVLDSSLHPTTIGIFGSWGSGKSCLAGMLCQALEDEKNLLCIEFNAWTFEGFEDAKSALMGTILERLLEERKLPAKTRDRFLRLLHAVDVRRALTLAARVLGPATSAALAAPDPAVAVPAMLAAGAAAASTMPVEEVAGILQPTENAGGSPRKGMREFRGEFEKLLDEADLSTLVVFIDDLDRCLPDTVVEVLEAIRLFLSTPKTVFVVCADERLVRSAVRRRFPPQPGDDFDVANEYLEKLIQHPIRIHALGAVDVRLYLALLLIQGSLGEEFPKSLAEVTTRAEIEATSTRQLVTKLLPKGGTEAEEIVALVDQIADVLGVHLRGNPRQLKRFMNTLMLRMGMAADRGLTLKRRVLAKLMVLEYAKLSFFRQLSEWQASQAGRPAQLAAMERRARPSSTPAAAKSAKGLRSDATEGGTESASGRDPNVTLWASDPWIGQWLRSEPLLASEDLRPYFLFSRDRLGLTAAGGEVLTPAAQSCLDLFLSRSKLQRGRAPRAAAALSAIEASSVLQVLAEQCRRAQSLGGEASPLEALVALVTARAELAAEAMMLFNELSVTVLTAGAPPLMAALARDVPSTATAVDKLLQDWGSQGTNTMLAEAVRTLKSRSDS